MSYSPRKAREEREQIYREHNIVRPGQGTGSVGVVDSKPNPHDLRCQCDDCRKITRGSHRTIAGERGEQ